MPRKVLPAQLWLRPAQHGREALYLILDRGRQISTGHGPDAREAAERKLSEYLESKHDLPAQHKRHLEPVRITTHPGEILKEEFMEPLGLSARALAEALDVPPNRLAKAKEARK